MVQTGLVTGNAGVDFVATALLGLANKLAIRQQRPGHGHHVRLARRQNLFAFLRGVDSIGRAHRDIHFAIELGGDIGKAATGHRGNNGGHPGFMPANPGIDDGGSCPLNGLAQCHNLFPGLATLDQVQHGQPVDNDEFRPNSFAHTADNLHGQAHTVLVRATPLVRSLVGPLTQKLVDEIAFGAHHLNAIITRKFGELRGTDEIVDLPFNPFRGKGAGLERAYRGLGCRCRDNQRLIAITPCVQDLHTDLSAGLMNRAGHMAMQQGRGPVVHG